MEDKLQCVVCGFEMTNYQSREGVQPSGGLAFVTGGHYGSTVFDPMDGTRIEICICDPCLVAAGKKGQVHETYCTQSPKHKTRTWRPDGPTTFPTPDREVTR